jgi:hypothetical protein
VPSHLPFRPSRRFFQLQRPLWRPEPDCPASQPQRQRTTTRRQQQQLTMQVRPLQGLVFVLQTEPLVVMMPPLHSFPCSLLWSGLWDAELRNRKRL